MRVYRFTCKFTNQYGAEVKMEGQGGTEKMWTKYVHKTYGKKNIITKEDERKRKKSKRRIAGSTGNKV